MGSKLAAVAEAETALEEQKAKRPPLPDKPSWQPSPQTCGDCGRTDYLTKGPQRVLRTLVPDVTLARTLLATRSASGIRWSSVQRTAHGHPHTDAYPPSCNRPHQRRKLEEMRDTDIAAELSALGLRTARGHEFRTRDVRNLRHSIGLARPSPLEAGELTVKPVAEQLGVKPGTVYYWLRIGLLPSPPAGNRRSLHPLLPRG